MSLSSEYFEYHLTADGWVEGNDSKDFAGKTERPVPSNRELTVRFSERMSSAYSEMERNFQVVWHGGNQERVSQLIKRFGCPPHPYAEMFSGIEEIY